MTEPGQNEGFRILDEFVSEAISTSAAKKPAPSNEARNEGMRVAEELAIDLDQVAPPERNTPTRQKKKKWWQFWR